MSVNLSSIINEAASSAETSLSNFLLSLYPFWMKRVEG